MFSDHLVLQGKDGVKWLNQEGPYAVIVNKTLYAWGKAGKFTVVNVSEAWVDTAPHVFNCRPNRGQGAFDRRPAITIPIKIKAPPIHVAMPGNSCMTT